MVSDSLKRSSSPASTQQPGPTTQRETTTAPVILSPNDYPDLHGEYDSAFGAREISLTTKQSEQFRNALRENSVEWKYGTFYYVDEALEQIRKGVPRTQTHSGAAFQGKTSITADELYQNVIANNDEFLRNLSKREKKLYTKMESEKLQGICETIVKSVNEICRGNSGIDLAEYMCVLSQLKILYNGSYDSYGRVEKNYCLGLSPSLINLSKYLKGEGFESDAILHEAAHLVQINCPHNPAQTGVSVDYDAFPNNNNPLFWSWFYEAAAEQTAMDNTGHAASNYQIHIAFAELLNLAAILTDGNASGHIDRVNQDKDVLRLFDMFGCQTEEEIKEAIRMMYGIEISHKMTNHQRFYSDYEKKMDTKLSEDEFSNMKGWIAYDSFAAISKVFYWNLTEYLVGQRLSVGDVFYLIASF